jgi:signal transduction histidine kinase
MLDVSRHENGDIPLQRSEVRLDKIIEAVKDQVTPRARSKEMELMFDPLPKVSSLWVDESMIRRALVNLVDNAIKYTPRQGKISLSANQIDDILHIAISDNGPGISQEDQAYIFDKFSRVDHSSDAPSGVGLGLTFCKLAVAAHGGTISVESEGVPGQGSTFHVSIPLIEKTT